MLARLRVSATSNDKPRVTSNMRVYVLSHRIPSIALRRDARERAAFIQRLTQEEASDTIYVTYSKWWSRLLYIRDSYGNEISVKPGDLIRV